MKHKHLEKWEKIRKLGKLRYVLIHGVLMWGLGTGIVWSIVMQIFQPQEPWYIRPAIALIIFPLGGLLFGKLTWNANEKKYYFIKSK